MSRFAVSEYNIKHRQHTARIVLFFYYDIVRSQNTQSVGLHGCQRFFERKESKSNRSRSETVSKEVNENHPVISLNYSLLSTTLRLNQSPP